MKHSLHIAHIGLLDAAPLLVAQEKNFFTAEGLEVRLSCELGLASVCGKLVDQRVDGACLPAALPVLLSLGAGVPRVAMQAVQVCARQGMALVLTPKATGRGAGGSAPRVGVITPGTPTRLFLQKLPQAAPDALAADFTQVPMAASQLIDFLREGMLEGFCGIDPLPALARGEGTAKIVAESATLFPMHPGSVVALRADVAERDPKPVAALARALQRAREYCAAPGNRAELWRLVLAQAPYAGMEAAARAALAAGGDSKADGASMRFDGRPGLSAVDDVNFVEAACRGAIGPGSRGMDLKAEIARVFATCPAANAPATVAKN